MSHWWYLDPTDVWFFRDAKPFTAGESHRAESRFPPAPTTVLGALRTALIAGAGMSFEEFKQPASPAPDPSRAALRRLVGTPTEPGALAVQGPFLCRRSTAGVEVLLRPPLDRLGHNQLTPLADPLPGVHFNGGPRRLLWAAGPGDTQREAPAGALVSLSNLLAHLADPHCALDLHASEQELFQRETHTGLELGPGRTARPGMFYLAEMIRPSESNADQRCGLTIRIGQIPDGTGPVAGAIALGGKGRSAWFSPMPDEDADTIERALSDHAAEVQGAIRQTRRFRLYAAAPAIFAAGWHPDFLEADGKGTIGTGTEAIRVELVSAAVGKPEPTGGWDLADGRSKPLYRAVPAGSVYHFRIPDSAPFDEAAARRLVTRFNFADGFRAGGASSLPNKVTAGFGLTAIGTWDPRSFP